MLLLRPTSALRVLPIQRTLQSIGLRTMSSQAEPLVLTSRSPSNNVAIFQLNRPKALNALSSELFAVLNQELDKADNDDSVKAIVLTGSEKAFAAGADIKEMQNKEFAENYRNNFLYSWTQVTRLRKPVIGAVSGHALGGGCELAMMCDILICNEKANFGQPEINLGIIPGAGGSQRMTHLIGKNRAMDLVLTGRTIRGKQAEEWGLVSRCVAEGENVVDEAVKIGDVIASKGDLSVQAGKEAVNAALELPLEQGLRLERRLFHALFATADQKEGMGAFVEKRRPNFTGK